MFTDIVGYTKLMGADEDRAFRVLKINREIHQQQLAKFNGTLIKEMGDGMLISFPSAMNAVKCAMAIQEEARMENIPLKIGIHEADVVFEGGDVLGDGVNIASRIQDNAEEGSINISGYPISPIIVNLASQSNNRSSHLFSSFTLFSSHSMSLPLSNFERNLIMNKVWIMFLLN